MKNKLDYDKALSSNPFENLNLKLIENEIENISKLISEKIEENERVIFVSIGLIADVINGLSHDMEYHFSFDNKNIIALNHGLAQRPIDTGWKTIGDIGAASVFDLNDIALNSNDVVIGVSSSGTTNYVKTALKFASSITDNVFLITNNNSIEFEKGKKIYVDAGDDVVNIGSFNGVTMNKFIIDKILITSMMKAGRIINGYSVFKKWNYESQTKEIINILSTLTKLSYEKCEEIFNDSKKVMSVAYCRLVKDISNDEAKELLVKVKNNLNKLE